MSPSSDASQVVVFTDLDGSLLDPVSYSWEAARDALEALHRRQIPLILVSSKTRAEIKALRPGLGHRHPFIAENGGAVFIPPGYFTEGPSETPTREGDEVIKLGTPYESLRHALKEIERAVGVHLRGFGDMTVEEVADRTGLAPAEAKLSMKREYDEPFLIEGPESSIHAVERAAKDRGLSVTRGGRFHHLLGQSDKGRACLHLLDRFRRHRLASRGMVTSIAVGDSANDLPMLRVVDYPVLVQNARDSYDPDIQLSNLIRAPGVGPAGWNQAVLELLNTRLSGETGRPAMRKRSTPPPSS